MATFIATDASLGVNFDNLDVNAILSGALAQHSATLISSVDGPFTDNFTGSFQYDSQGALTGGVLNGVQELYFGQPLYTLSGLSTPVTSFAQWVATGDSDTVLKGLFAGADLIQGTNYADTMGGYGGADTIFGGGGNDGIVGGDGVSYLRGDAGNDIIVGGANFDDINGNTGDDSAAGGDGNDWVVGGKDNDILLGQSGDDIVYGNIGDDICSGGTGADLVRGGQDNDSLQGNEGDDWLSGDRGSDTISGGSGADVFHTFSGAGLDVVTDFSRAEGDRVQLDPGTTYSVSQVGADTVIDMGGGDKMVLVGVQSSTLTGDWIFTY